MFSQWLILFIPTGTVIRRQWFTRSVRKSRPNGLSEIGHFRVTLVFASFSKLVWFICKGTLWRTVMSLSLLYINCLCWPIQEAINQSRVCSRPYLLERCYGCPPKDDCSVEKGVYSRGKLWNTIWWSKESSDWTRKPAESVVTRGQSIWFWVKQGVPHQRQLHSRECTTLSQIPQAEVCQKDFIVVRSLGKKEEKRRRLWSDGRTAAGTCI